VSAPPGNQAGTDGAVDTNATSGQPQLAIDRTTANLGSVIVGQTSAPATFTITNTGAAASGTVQASVTGAGYAPATNGCTGTLAPNASCQVSVTVTPSAPGTPSGSLMVTATAGGTVNASLAATALTVGVLAATPPGFGFGTTVAGTTSGMTTITVQNTGGQATGVIGVVLGGADPSEFEITSDGCVGMSLASYASCQLVARFRPGAPSAGAKSATITATANPGGAAVTALTGTAQPPAVLALSGSGTFGDTLVGTPVVGTFMVTNASPVVGAGRGRREALAGAEGVHGQDDEAQLDQAQAAGLHHRVAAGDRPVAVHHQHRRRRILEHRRHVNAGRHPDVRPAAEDHLLDAVALAPQDADFLGLQVHVLVGERAHGGEPAASRRAARRCSHAFLLAGGSSFARSSFAWARIRASNAFGSGLGSTLVGHKGTPGSGTGRGRFYTIRAGTRRSCCQKWRLPVPATPGPRARRLARGFIAIALRAHRGGWSPEGDRSKAPGESSSPGSRGR